MNQKGLSQEKISLLTHTCKELFNKFKELWREAKGQFISHLY